MVLVSATLPHEVLEMTRKFMTDPVRILVKRDELTLEGIKQFFVAVERSFSAFFFFKGQGWATLGSGVPPDSALTLLVPIPNFW